MRYYETPGSAGCTSKADDSPLTLADLDSHRLLEQGLRMLAPGLPLLSEESPPEVVAARRQWRRFWLVDPLDGTREFLDRTDEFTVNIALIEGARPTLGILYLPVQRCAYVGVPGAESSCYRRSDSGWVGRTTTARRLDPARTLAIHTSRRPGGARLQACIDRIAGEAAGVERVPGGSAMKFCRLADGEGDFYPRFSPCSEWDVAAGQAVLEAAGGAVLGLDGQALRYNTRDTLRSPAFYGIADPAHPFWRHLTVN